MMEAHTLLELLLVIAMLGILYLGGVIPRQRGSRQGHVPTVPERI